MRAAQRVLETALLCAQQALGLRDIDTLFAGSLERTQIESLLENIQRDWQDKGLELVPIASGWRFQSRPDVHVFLERLHPEKPQRYTRATLETLAIIAYHQPCTRAEIESVRGVSLSKGTLDLLLEMDFVRLRGRRRTPGRPVTYATTDRFLEHFSLASLYDLPGVQEMKAAGLLDLSIPVGFEVPDPTRSGESEGEDLLTALDDGSPEFAQDFVSED